MVKKWKPLEKTITCSECANEFTVPFSKRSRKYCSITCTNKNKYHPNSSNKITSVINGFKMDSGAETIFAERCNELKISWIKNTKTSFDFVDSTNKTRKYYPDFYLPDHDLWVEIKGKRYIRPDDELRRAAVDRPVLLIISNNFKNDFESFLAHLNLTS